MSTDNHPQSGCKRDPDPVLLLSALGPFGLIAGVALSLWLNRDKGNVIH